MRVGEWRIGYRIEYGREARGMIGQRRGGVRWKGRIGYERVG